MKVLKGYVRQMARAEGSMAEGHLHYEALFYCGDAMRAFDRTAPTAWEEAQDERMTGMILQGAKNERVLGELEHAQVHNFVLLNDARMQPFVDEYQGVNGTSDYGVQVRRPPTLAHFLPWVREKIHRMLHDNGPHSVPIDVQCIVRGPLRRATSYTHIWESGRHFRVDSLDVRRRSTTDSGVICTPHDGDDMASSLPYCGVIEDILEVDFGHFNVVLLGGRWYKFVSSGQGQTVINDECGFLRVNTRHLQSRARPYSDVWVYPSQVDQCFYIELPNDPHWSLVVPVFPRGRRAGLRGHEAQDNV